MPRAALNRCKFCGDKCKFETCSRSCKIKLWNKENPGKAKIKLEKLIAAHVNATRKRWVARIKELIPGIIFTKEQEIIIAKALAAQNRYAYTRGFSRGKWLGQQVYMKRKF